MIQDGTLDAEFNKNICKRHRAYFAIWIDMAFVIVKSSRHDKGAIFSQFPQNTGCGWLQLASTKPEKIKNSLKVNMDIKPC